MSLSSEAKLTVILEKKEDIRKATDEISEIIKQLGKGSSYLAAVHTLKKMSGQKIGEDPYYKLDEQNSVIVRQKLHKIVSDMSTIASFCDKKTQSYIMRISKVAAEIAAGSEITHLEGFILESFCTMVNSIIVDYNKMPFSLSAEFKLGFDKFIASVRGKYKKGKLES
jgi:hypothetical protein